MTTAAAGGLAAPEIDLAFSLEPGTDADALSPEPLTDLAGAEALWGSHLGAWLAQLRPELPAPLHAEGYSLGLELTGDATIAELNQTWRQHSGPTDVLAFAAQEEAPPAPAGAEPDWLELGDIVISLDTARRQAEAAGHDLREELLFLASHGLLHLLGWDHPDEGSLEAMLALQSALLAASPS